VPSLLRCRQQKELCVFWSKAKVEPKALAKAEELYGRAMQAVEAADEDAALSYANLALEQYVAAKAADGEARARALMAAILIDLEQYEPAARHYEVAADLFKGAEDTAHSLAGLGEASQSHGNLEKAVDAYEAALRLHRRLESDSCVLRVTYNLAFTHFELENWAEAEKHYGAALALAEQMGLRDQHFHILMELGNAVAQQGRYVEACLHFERAVEDARVIGDEHTLADALQGLAVTFVKAGQRERAREAFHESVELKRGLNDPECLAEGLYEQGLNDGELGRCRDAVAALTEAVDLFEALRHTAVGPVREALAQYAADCREAAAD
jgi:tetratricopeptide (TPR) repeat protein